MGVHLALMTLGLKTYREGLGHISNARAPWGWEDLSSNTRGRYTYQLVGRTWINRNRQICLIIPLVTVILRT